MHWLAALYVLTHTRCCGMPAGQGMGGMMAGPGGMAGPGMMGPGPAMMAPGPQGMMGPMDAGAHALGTSRVLGGWHLQYPVWRYREAVHMGLVGLQPPAVV